MLAIHRAFPHLMQIIGRLLVEYGDLEVDLMNCVQVARGYDMNNTLKSMFRARGESKRIKIAADLGGPAYADLGLGAEFTTAIDTFDYCRQIRNKYSHSYWHDPDMGKALCYVSLEELADDDKPVNDLTNLIFYYLDEPLLLKQEAYFKYVRDLIRYINYEGQTRSRKMRSNPFTLPKEIEKPPFFTRTG
jgi:hypothetical protein